MAESPDKRDLAIALAKEVWKDYQIAQASAEYSQRHCFVEVISGLILRLAPEAAPSATLPLKQMAYELDGVLEEFSRFGNFDRTSRATVERVRDFLKNTAAQGWMTATAPTEDQPIATHGE